MGYVCVRRGSALSSVAWQVALCVALVSSVSSQRTYERSCACEKTLNGMCSYTLLLPTGSGADGTCPTKDDSDESEHSLAALDERTTELESWTGAQAKAIVSIQNDIASLKVQVAGGVSVSDCDPCELKAKFEAWQVENTSVEFNHTMPNITMPNITMPDITMPDVTMPDITMPDVTAPEITVPDFNVEIEKLDVKFAELETRLSTCHCCLKKGPLFIKSVLELDTDAISVSSVFNSTFSADLARIDNTSPDSPGAWCPGRRSVLSYDEGFHKFDDLMAQGQYQKHLGQ